MAEKQVAITTTIITAQRDKIVFIEFSFRCHFKGDYMMSLNELVCTTDSTGTACDPFVAESRPVRRARRMTPIGSHLSLLPDLAPKNDARPCKTKIIPLMMIPSKVGSIPFKYITAPHIKASNMAHNIKIQIVFQIFGICA